MLLARRGELVARLANNAADLDAIQNLRYEVFFRELNAKSDAVGQKNKRDIDRFDEYCDHLLVVKQTSNPGNDAITVEDGELVGTYRLLRQEVADKHRGFYTQSEFDISSAIENHSTLQFLELGRSCVTKPFRTKPVVELLWQGIWNYFRHYKLDVMIGCASLPGTNLDALKLPLSFLSRNFKAPDDWRIQAHPHCRSNMNLVGEDELDERQALKALPTLIKGYLRLGAYIGEGAVIDRQFSTTDVLIILPLTAINPKYFKRFGAPGD